MCFQGGDYLRIHSILQERLLIGYIQASSPKGSQALKEQCKWEIFTKLDLKEESVQKQYSLCSYTDKISIKEINYWH